MELLSTKQLEKKDNRKNKEIENLLYNHYGYKFLCNMNYYSENFFWEIYDRKRYLEIKEIIDYNRVDCKVLQEIYFLLKKNYD